MSQKTIAKMAQADDEADPAEERRPRAVARSRRRARLRADQNDGSSR